ncbi:ATP-binding protein [Peribacillus sp. SCS-155]|uniref:ATP-binding protein n=1 Tax=Peribacillus sedimenti TaxID=3115297 RepID=UPI003906B606
MLEDINQLFNQILIVLALIHIYHLFFHENRTKRKKITSKLTFILLIMLLLIMTIPLIYRDGYLYDLRMIPIILAFFYCGFHSGLLIFGVMLLYRFYLGGLGFYVTLITYSFIVIIILFLANRFEKLALKRKLIGVSCLYWLYSVTKAITLCSAQEKAQLPFMVLFSVITWAVLITVLLVIENVNEQVMIRDELQRADKLNVISQLAASVAHEVRNPMTSVRGFLQLISKDENLHASQRDYIRIALDELSHAQSIINDYLSLAKPNTGKLRLLNLSEEIQNITDLMTSYSNIQNISIYSSIQEGLFIKGNKDEIKQVLVNIMKNGIEAMETGGSINIRAYSAAESVFIEIKDNGKGMTKDQLKLLGTPFYSTKEKGTGVGLTISYQIIESMKGIITVESNVGQGTKFTIKLPQVVK